MAHLNTDTSVVFWIATGRASGRASIGTGAGDGGEKKQTDDNLPRVGASTTHVEDDAQFEDGISRFDNDRTDVDADV